jgi:hypothetical protein
VNCIGGLEQGIKPNQWGDLSAVGREKRTVGIESEAQRTDARRIVQRQHIIDVVIGLLRENFFPDGTLNQDAAPTVRPAILNGAEKRCRMMRAALQGKRGRINRKGAIMLKPSGVILERN